MDESTTRELEKLVEDFRAAQERGDFTRAEGAAIQSLMAVAAEAQRNPSERLQRVLEAHEHAAAARWDQAEAAYRQALAAAEAEGKEALICESHRQLCGFYATQGQAGRALEEAQAALAAARKSGLSALLLMALEGLFGCQLRKCDLASATATAEEAVRVASTETAFDHPRAAALLMRARLRVERGEIAPAEQDLDAAWRILAPQAEATFLGGIQNSLANWWEITARIKTWSKDFPGAAQALGKAVEFRRTVSHLPQLDGLYKYHWLAEGLQEYGVTLLAAGDVKAATEAFDESRKIQERTGIAVPPPRAG
ncbi:MAG: hypothetical protein M1541_03075 [Acidobacteria bacterium]|nr:hypothetical protein [Acidobacteriota bacterium]